MSVVSVTPAPSLVASSVTVYSPGRRPVRVAVLLTPFFTVMVTGSL